MTKEEQRNIIETGIPIKPKYMIGTEAYHLLGDISSDKEDLFYTSMEAADYWIGQWVTGFGFINVLFPKKTSRELTDEEIKYWNSRYIQIGSHPLMKMKVD
jgi:hypothetical protein